MIDILSARLQKRVLVHLFLLHFRLPLVEQQSGQLDNSRNYSYSHIGARERAVDYTRDVRWCNRTHRWSTNSAGDPGRLYLPAPSLRG